MINLQKIIETMNDIEGRVETSEQITTSLENKQDIMDTKMDFISKNLELMCTKIINIEKIILDSASSDTRHSKDKLIIIVSAITSGAIALIIAILNKVI